MFWECTLTRGVPKSVPFVSMEWHKIHRWDNLVSNVLLWRKPKTTTQGQDVCGVITNPLLWHGDDPITTITTITIIWKYRHPLDGHLYVRDVHCRGKADPVKLTRSVTVLVELYHHGNKDQEQRQASAKKRYFSTNYIFDNFASFPLRCREQNREDFSEKLKTDLNNFTQFISFLGTTLLAPVPCLVPIFAKYHESRAS